MRTAPLLAQLVVLGATACTVGPNFESPAPWWSPASYADGRPAQPAVPTKATQASPASAPVAEPVDAQWWTSFGDPQLTELEAKVAAGNLDVRVASIRLAESRATLGIAQAAQVPDIDGSASYARQKLSDKGILSLSGSGAATTGGSAGVPNTNLFAPFNVFQYGFDASWELDFWGHVRRQVESADAQATETEEQRRATLLTALAEVARDYVTLRGTQRTLEITRENLGYARESLDLTRQREEGGVTTDLDVANAAGQVATVEAQIPPLQAQEAAAINAISLLLGMPPNALRAELTTQKPIPPVPARVPIGLPSELARRRPDIRAAEAQLHAATADIGVAVAEFYPRVTLNGSVALQAVDASALTSLTARTYNVGPAISLPIFEGGRIKRTVELREAQQQEAAIAYQHTILAALHDVDNALTAYDTEQRRHDQLAQAVDANRHALSLARDRYAQGIADFLAVLDAERNLLGAETQFTASTTTISTDLVQLYKSLGGGWEPAYPVDATARTAGL